MSSPTISFEFTTERFDLGTAFGKHDKAVQFIALDDRELPGAGLGDGGRCPRPLVAPDPIPRS